MQVAEALAWTLKPSGVLLPNQVPVDLGNLFILWLWFWLSFVIFLLSHSALMALPSSSLLHIPTPAEHIEIVSAPFVRHSFALQSHPYVILLWLILSSAAAFMHASISLSRFSISLFHVYKSIYCPVCTVFALQRWAFSLPYILTGSSCPRVNNPFTSLCVVFYVRQLRWHFHSPSSNRTGAHHDTDLPVYEGVIPHCFTVQSQQRHHHIYKSRAVADS